MATIKIRSGTAWVPIKGLTDNLKKGTSTIDFGAGDTSAAVVITGQAWVTAASVIVPAIYGSDEALIEGLQLTVSDLLAGVGFTITAAPTNGQAIGQYQINWIGG